MGSPIKVKYKFGQIEFEAEGDSYDVEKQRDYFMNAIIPVATSILNNVIKPEIPITPTETRLQPILINEAPEKSSINTNRTNLITYLKPVGDLSDVDFVLFAAYYNEQKSTESYVFTSEDVKFFFQEARRSIPSNPSDIIQRLAKRGHIVNGNNQDNKNQKSYLISQDGINYINTYTPKIKNQKKNAKSTVNAAQESLYSCLTIDDLNISKYPDIRTIKNSKEKIILVMYIITNENKGIWFKNSDLEYILLNLFDTHVTKDQVSNVFRKKSWFETKKDETRSRQLTHRMLSPSKEFAKQLIEQYSQ